jgi:transcriptional regulator with XRE-family HTH domain
LLFLKYSLTTNIFGIIIILWNRIHSKGDVIVLGENIRAIRKKRGLSINKLAELSNISLGYLSNLENNKLNNPTLDKLKALADILEVPVEEFFKEGQEDTNGPENRSEFRILPLIPKQFSDSEEARAFVKSFAIFGSNGFDSNKLDDKEIVKFANELLEHMDIVKYKYKK